MNLYWRWRSDYTPFAFGRWDELKKLSMSEKMRKMLEVVRNIEISNSSHVVYCTTKFWENYGDKEASVGFFVLPANYNPGAELDGCFESFVGFFNGDTIDLSLPDNFGEDEVRRLIISKFNETLDKEIAELSERMKKVNSVKEMLQQ